MNADFSFHTDDVVLNEYLDSALTPERRADVETHLARCATCAAQLAEMRALFSVIESLPNAPLERDLTRQVLAALQPQPAPWPPIVRWVFAVQAVLAIVFVVVAALALFSTLTPPNAFIRPALDSFTEVTGSWATQWRAAWAAIQIAVASIIDSTLAFLPVSFEWTWFAGLVAVLLLWLAGNGVILSRIISSPSRSHS